MEAGLGWDRSPVLKKSREPLERRRPTARLTARIFDPPLLSSLPSVQIFLLFRS
jgi:hypothetical protein